MKKDKIYIYDDESPRGTRYKDTLKKVDALKEFDIHALSDPEFKSMFDELNERRKVSKKGCTGGKKSNKADEAKVFIVDFRLIELTSGLNGEEVAYDLLCFSDCEYIIGLNRYSMDSTFDLTLLGHLDSYVDLNISHKDLKNQGLWTGEPKRGYRPWYWPAILHYLKNREKQIDEIMNHFDDPIFETLKIPEHIMRSIPNRASNYLGTSRKDVTKTTFEDFFSQSELVLTPRDREIQFPSKRKAKIIASRLSKWFEKAILPGQNILVDAPHLIARYPSLLKGNRKKIDTWNKTAKFGKVSELGIHHNKIEECSFDQHWASRPVWFWSDVSEISEIEEVKEPWKRSEYDFVFAEDASSFYKKGECRTFVSNVESPFRLRYVKRFRFGGIDYRPVHLLFKR
jgi:hypothetical protein